MVRKISVLALVLAWAGPAQADKPVDPWSGSDPATEAAKLPTPSSPDVVVLKNGNRYRGTIAELVKGEFVSIVLATSETRKFAWDEVEFAGAAADAPTQVEPQVAPAVAEPPAAPLPPRNPNVHPVRFVSDRTASLFFLRGTSEPTFRPTCIAPCAHELKSGSYAVAVRIQEELMYPDQWVIVDEPTRITATYRDRSGVRAAGAVVLIVTAVTVGVTIAAVAAAASSNPYTGAPIIFGAAIPGLIGGVVGIALLATDDKVVVRASKL